MFVRQFALCTLATLAMGADPVDLSDWFPFTPKNDVAPGPLGMQDWLRIGSTPVVSREGKLWVDGKPMRFWGTNVEYDATKPEAAKAEQTARWFAKQGVNLVRQHKLTNPGWEGLGGRSSASVYEPADLEKFDYFNHQLRTQGIYYAFSPIWDLKVRPADRDKLKYYDELVAHGGKSPDTTGLVWFMDDVQKLHIEALVNLVGHRNPHSGLRYAEDPALAYVEIQNEEDVFFFTVTPDFTKYPSYKRDIAALFSDWLIKRYGNEDALMEAWGAGWNTFAKEGGFPNESLSARNVVPVSSPWLLDNHGSKHPRAARLQDTARFLYECQDGYYRRATQALRDIGYKGMIIGSNWQGGDGIGHFLNLASDAAFDIVDRHNYLAGAKGMPKHEMHTGHPFLNATTLDQPGSALLSTGLQQVGDKPFMLSEWLAIPPHEWAAAETAIIAFYGMGLQGWDLSAHFASNHHGFTPTLNFPGKKKFNNQTAHGIGLYPVLSRAVLRGDITEAEIIADRRLSVEQAIKRSYDFEHGTKQEHDLKSFTGTPGPEALAIGRVVVSFAEGDQKSRIVDLARYRQGDTLVSTTGELRWRAPGGKETGSIQVNSAGTQGIIGFAAQQAHKLGQMSITPHNTYSVILMTAREEGRTLATCKQAILQAIARVRNTGMRLEAGKIIELGTGPQIIEPVRATLVFERKPSSVIALDADGQPLGEPLLLTGNTLEMDTGSHRAFSYLVTF